MKDPVETVTKNNRRMLRGVCLVCGGKVCKILGKKID